MSFYNTLFGTNILMPVLIKVLNLSNVDIPRFRDAYWDGTHIVILTRTGGNNRDSYQEGINFLKRNKNYVYDEDDSYDNTYAQFYFSLPSEFEHIRGWLNDRISPSPSQKWEDLLSKLEDEKYADDPVVKKVLAFSKELIDKIDVVLKNKDTPEIKRAEAFYNEFNRSTNE